MPRKRDYGKKYRVGVLGFIFPYTIGRGEYFARTAVVNLLFVPVKLIVEKSDNVLVLLICLVIGVTWLVASFWISIIPRIRDLDWNTKLTWLCFIPGINIIFGMALLVTPGK